MKQIIYFYSAASPWSYLGAQRLYKIAKDYSAEIIEKPIDLIDKVFPATGGVVMPKRHPARLAYRLVELKRWSEYLNIKLNLTPKFFPVKDPHLPSLFCIASNEMGKKLDFSFKMFEHLWAKENDIASLDTLKIIAEDLKLNFSELHKLALSDKIKNIYEKNTKEAIALNVFGVPTYFYKNQMFWGQDRLDFLEKALKNS